MTDRIERFTYNLPHKGRLDLFLSSCLPDLSRTRIQNLIKNGFAYVDNASVTKPGFSLEAGASIELHIPPPAPVNMEPEALPLDILFENDDLVIVNKPAGMVVHPSPGHDRGTLVHAALAHIPGLVGIGGAERPGIVHRLDKETSGLIVVAKHDGSHQWLQDQFRSRNVEKTYLALVDGQPPTPTGRVDAPIGRSTAHRKLMAIVPAGKGREAVSEYRTLERFQHHTLLEVHPLTGRTHQIRVHLAFLGCPVAGDRVYGKKKGTLPLKRQFLHAYRLKIVLPGGKVHRLFEAPLPAELEDILSVLRQA